MGTYKSKIVDNIICDKLTGELDSAFAAEWVDKLEEQEKSTPQTLYRFHDVRGIDAVHLSFDDLWNFAQRRIKSYEQGNENSAAFWVSTPLNYGVSRMYQALTDGTPFKIEVFYNLDEVADYLGVNQKLLEEIEY